jgi:predicted N-acetyltransferase YhbS
MNIKIAHLYEHPDFVPVVARWIHEEWWKDEPGHTVQTMAARLRLASTRDSIPLSLIALADDRPAGTVNLVESDDDSLPHLSPWLAAMLVAPEYRGLGIGEMLVRSLLAEAGRLGFEELYLGADIPRFYEQFGAEVYEKVTESFCIMRLPVVNP